MEQGLQFIFGPFRLDTARRQLWRGKRQIALSPRPLAVLQYLAEHPGRVASKAELLKQVWVGTVVTGTTLKVCVRVIREALGENAAAPRYLETVGREGYRFIAPVTSTQLVSSSRFQVSNSEPEPTPDPQFPTPIVVGRAAELEQLHAWWGQAERGQRQVVFVSGEPGIGKTTLVDAFLQSLASHAPRLASKTSSVASRRVQTLDPRRQTLDAHVWIGRGQCLEQYGAGEAYMPVFEALEQICRAPGGRTVIEILSRYAPTWLLQMPALVEEPALAVLQQKVSGATRERMLREMADALEALTVERGVILVLEDLHASDLSTVELLAYLAQRRERARLLVVGTYRPAVLVMKEHPLRGIVRELRAHAQCQELKLELLTEANVSEYLAKRLVTEAVPRTVAAQIYERTDGNALFLVTVVEYLLQQGLFTEVAGQWRLQHNLEAAGLPESLRQMLEKQLEQLGAAERRVLEAASVQGYEFDSAVIGRALALQTIAVEDQLAMLEHAYGFVRLLQEEELPDRTLTLRYRFAHVLYQDTLYAALRPTRKTQLSGVVAQALRGYYEDKSGVVAVELAHLYEVARDFAQAADYFLLAAQRAATLFAHTETVALARQGLAMLQAAPETPECARQELMLQLTLGFSLGVTQGYATLEAERSMRRAQEICGQLGDAPQLFPAIWGLALYYIVAPDFHVARQLGEQLLRLARRAQDPILLVGAHTALGFTLHNLGELGACLEHLEEGIAFHDPQQHQVYLFLFSLDPGLYCQGLSSLALWLLGYPDQAQRRIREALALAQETSDPRSRAFVLLCAAFFHQYCREAQKALEQAELSLMLCREHGVAQERAWAAACCGWALTEQEQLEDGLTQMQEGLAALRAMQAENTFPHFLALLSGALSRAGKIEEALAVVAEALSMGDRTGEHYYKAELYRLQGELSLQKLHTSDSSLQVVEKTKGKNQKAKISDLQFSISHSQLSTSNAQAEGEVEACFQQAIEIARRQGAKSLELRAVMSLSRLWRRQGKQKQACQMLTEIYDWFTEGFDTADLQEAKALLADLRR